jgi:hypothetical protein
MFAGGCSELGSVGNPKGRKYKGVIKLRKESHGCIFINERELKGLLNGPQVLYTQ